MIRRRLLPQMNPRQVVNGCSGIIHKAKPEWLPLLSDITFNAVEVTVGGSTYLNPVESVSGQLKIALQKRSGGCGIFFIL